MTPCTCAPRLGGSVEFTGHPAAPHVVFGALIDEILGALHEADALSLLVQHSIHVREQDQGIGVDQRGDQSRELIVV